MSGILTSVVDPYHVDAGPDLLIILMRIRILILCDADPDLVFMLIRIRIFI
jgi:hypothetical protein